MYFCIFSEHLFIRRPIEDCFWEVMSKNQNQNIKEISAGIAKKFDGIIKNKGLSNTGSATMTVTHIKNDKIRDA